MRWKLALTAAVLAAGMALAQLVPPDEDTPFGRLVIDGAPVASSGGGAPAIDPPVLDTFMIAGGDAYTDTIAVELNITATDADSMRFDNNDASWTAWAVYATTYNFTLTDSDGTRTVNAEVKNSGGTDTDSDTIILDTTDPVLTLFEVDDAYSDDLHVSNLQSPTLTTTVAGDDSMRFRNNSGEWQDWVADASSSAWQLTAVNDSVIVQAEFKDLAGNTTSAADTVIAQWYRSGETDAGLSFSRNILGDSGMSSDDYFCAYDNYVSDWTLGGGAQEPETSDHRVVNHDSTGWATVCESDYAGTRSWIYGDSFVSNGDSIGFSFWVKWIHGDSAQNGKIQMTISLDDVFTTSPGTDPYHYWISNDSIPDPGAGAGSGACNTVAGDVDDWYRIMWRVDTAVDQVCIPSIWISAATWRETEIAISDVQIEQIDGTGCTAPLKEPRYDYYRTMGCQWGKGPAFKDSASAWSKHDWSFVDSHQALDDGIQLGGVEDIRQINPDFGLNMYYQFSTIYNASWGQLAGYDSASYDTTDFFDTTTHLVDTARPWGDSDPDNRKGWFYSLNGDTVAPTNASLYMDMSYEPLVLAVAENYASFLANSDLGDTLGISVYNDFPTLEPFNWGTFDGHTAGQPIGPWCDLDQDGVAWEDDADEPLKWISGQADAYRQFQAAIPYDMVVISNNTENSMDDSFVVYNDGTSFEQFPKYGFGSPSGGTNYNYADAMDPNATKSIVDYLDEPWKASAGGPYLFIQTTTAAETEHVYADAAISLLWDETIIVFHENSSQNLYYPDVDFGTIGRPLGSVSFSDTTISATAYCYARRWFENGFVGVLTIPSEDAGSNAALSAEVHFEIVYNDARQKSMYSAAWPTTKSYQPPKITDFDIAGGAAETDTIGVTLNITADYADSMRFDNDDASWTAWAAYDTTYAFTLTDTPGVRTVNAECKNAYGTDTDDDTITLTGGCDYNMLEYSSDFSNEYWYTDEDIGVNTKTVPSGFSGDALEIVGRLPEGAHVSGVTLGDTNVISCYFAKSDTTLTPVYIWEIDCSVASNTDVQYEATGDDLDVGGGALDGGRAYVGDDWFRVWVSFVATPGDTATISLAPSIFAYGDGSAFMFGAQLDTGTAYLNDLCETP